MNEALFQVQDDAPPTTATRTFIAHTAVPAEALTWHDHRERSECLRRWRIGVSRRFAREARCLRVAWILEALFHRDGFAFPTDSYMAAELELPVNKIQSALTDLERSGSIIRASIMAGGRALRRIWPAKEITLTIPPKTGGMDTPQSGPRIPPVLGGQNKKEGNSTFSSRRMSSTANDAKRAAEISEQRARERDAKPIT